jgi:hypothetical protein
MRGLAAAKRHFDPSLCGRPPAEDGRLPYANLQVVLVDQIEAGPFGAAKRFLT